MTNSSVHGVRCISCMSSVLVVCRAIVQSQFLLEGNQVGLLRVGVRDICCQHTVGMVHQASDVVVFS